MSLSAVAKNLEPGLDSIIEEQVPEENIPVNDDEKRFIFPLVYAKLKEERDRIVEENFQTQRQGFESFVTSSSLDNVLESLADTRRWKIEDRLKGITKSDISHLDANGLDVAKETIARFRDNYVLKHLKQFRLTREQFDDIRSDKDTYDMWLNSKSQAIYHPNSNINDTLKQFRLTIGKIESAREEREEWANIASKRRTNAAVLQYENGIKESGDPEGTTKVLALYTKPMATLGEGLSQVIETSKSLELSLGGLKFLRDHNKSRLKDYLRDNLDSIGEHGKVYGRILMEFYAINQYLSSTIKALKEGKIPIVEPEGVAEVERNSPIDSARKSLASILDWSMSRVTAFKDKYALPVKETLGSIVEAPGVAYEVLKRNGSRVKEDHAKPALASALAAIKNLPSRVSSVFETTRAESVSEPAIPYDIRTRASEERARYLSGLVTGSLKSIKNAFSSSGEERIQRYDLAAIYPPLGKELNATKANGPKINKTLIKGIAGLFFDKELSKYRKLVSMRRMVRDLTPAELRYAEEMHETFAGEGLLAKLMEYSIQDRKNELDGERRATFAELYSKSVLGTAWDSTKKTASALSESAGQYVTVKAGVYAIAALPFLLTPTSALPTFDKMYAKVTANVVAVDFFKSIERVLEELKSGAGKGVEAIAPTFEKLIANAIGVIDVYDPGREVKIASLPNPDVQSDAYNLRFNPFAKLEGKSKWVRPDQFKEQKILLPDVPKPIEGGKEESGQEQYSSPKIVVASLDAQVAKLASVNETPNGGNETQVASLTTYNRLANRVPKRKPPVPFTVTGITLEHIQYQIGPKTYRISVGKCPGTVTQKITDGIPFNSKSGETSPYVIPELIDPMENMVEIAKKKGVNIIYTNLKRTLENQRFFYKLFRAGMGKPANSPSCGAPHNRAIAFDAKAYDSRYGGEMPSSYVRRLIIATPGLEPHPNWRRESHHGEYDGEIDKTSFPRGLAARILDMNAEGYFAGFSDFPIRMAYDTVGKQVILPSFNVSSSK